MGRLLAAVEALKAEKKGPTARDDAAWRALFTLDQLKSFWWPSPEEREAWNRFWFSTPLPKRHSPEMPLPPWDFASMIDAILEGEYELVGIRNLDATECLLQFDPEAYPFGGTGSLQALIRAFGFEVLGVDDGTGYKAGDFRPPLWSAI